MYTAALTIIAFGLFTIYMLLALAVVLSDRVMAHSRAKWPIALCYIALALTILPDIPNISDWVQTPATMARWSFALLAQIGTVYIFLRAERLEDDRRDLLRTLKMMKIAAARTKQNLVAEAAGDD